MKGTKKKLMLGEDEVDWHDDFKLFMTSRLTNPSWSPELYAKTVVIDFDGLEDRLMRVPVGPDNIFGLAAVKGHLLYSTSGPFFYGRSNSETSKLNIFSFEDRKASG